MAKKYFEAPYLKVVRVNNDIVTTSVNNELGNAKQLAPDRDDFDEEIEEW